MRTSDLDALVFVSVEWEVVEKEIGPDRSLVYGKSWLFIADNFVGDDAPFGIVKLRYIQFSLSLFRPPAHFS